MVRKIDGEREKEGEGGEIKGIVWSGGVYMELCGIS